MHFNIPPISMNVCRPARLFNREFKLRVIRRTANARQRKILRYQAMKSKWTCCFKTEIHNYSFDARMKIWNKNVQRKLCQEISNLPFPETWSLNSLYTIIFFVLFMFRDQDERQNKRIAQLIKDKMDQDKKLREEKLREENERYFSFAF